MFELRKLTENDYDEYLSVINEFRTTFFTKDQFIETLKYVNAYSEIWVMMADGAMVATGTIIYERKYIFNNAYLAHIEDVCVVEKCRKKGYGKDIVTKLMNRAKEHGCYKVTLDCNISNAPFYEKCRLEQRGVQMSQLTDNY
jgi:glucosamine-phosphate N-acetyltransferase